MGLGLFSLWVERGSRKRRGDFAGGLLPLSTSSSIPILISSFVASVLGDLAARIIGDAWLLLLALSVARSFFLELFLGSSCLPLEDVGSDETLHGLDAHR